MRKESFSPGFRPYRTAEDLVTVVLVTELNVFDYDEVNFIENPDHQNQFMEFSSKQAAIEWVNAHFEKNRIDPAIRLAPISLPEHNVVYRPYLNEVGFMSVVKIQNNVFEHYQFSRFLKNGEEGYVEFNREDEAIAWIHKHIKFHLIDPNYRIFNLDHYFKFPLPAQRKGKSQRSYPRMRRY